MRKKHKDKDPMALRPGDIANFETLKEAFDNGDLALVSSRRKADGAKVALVCAVSQDDGEYTMAPLAVMIEGDPYELFEDPVNG